MRFLPIAALGLVVAGVLASSASADSIVYAKDGNLFLTSPDRARGAAPAAVADRVGHGQRGAGDRRGRARQPDDDEIGRPLGGGDGRPVVLRADCRGRGSHEGGESGEADEGTGA